MKKLLAAALLLALCLPAWAEEDKALSVKAGTLVVLDSKTAGAKWVNAYKKDVQIKASSEGWCACVFAKPGDYWLAWYDAKGSDPTYVQVTVTGRPPGPLPDGAFTKALKDAHAKDQDPKGAKLDLLIIVYEKLAELELSEDLTWGQLLAAQGKAVTASGLKKDDIVNARKAVGEHVNKKLPADDTSAGKALGRDGASLARSTFAEVRDCLKEVKGGLK